MRGRHLLKAGALAEHYQDNMVNPTFSLGIYAFANLRAFLENRPLRFVGLTPQGAIDRYWRFTLYGFYAQDTFSHTRVSVNGGLRYEFTTMPVDIYGRDSALINLSDPAPTVGPLYQNPTLKNLSPRVGAAWDVFGDSSTAVRGGYGLYFNTNNQQNLIVTVTNPPATPRVIIANPTFPTPPFDRAIGNSIRPVQYDLQNPRIHMWNVSAERLLPRLRRHRRLRRVAWPAPVAQRRRERADADAAADGRQFFPAANTPRPNPNFSTIELKSSDGNSWYNALVVELRRRWRGGFSIVLHVVENRRHHPGVDVLLGRDQRHDVGVPGIRSTPTTTRARPTGTRRTTGSPTWCGRCRSAARAAPAALLSGWQLTAIGTMRSGQPLTVFVQNNRSRSQWSPSLAPNRARSPDLAPGYTAESAVLGRPDQWFDPAAFVLQPAGTLGNSGRGVSAPTCAPWIFHLPRTTGGARR